MTQVLDTKLNIKRRHLLTGLVGASLLPKAAFAFDVPPEPPEMHQDYAKIRQQFATKLVRKGPAPDKYEPLSPPAGAERIFYLSGANKDLILTAWLSPYRRERQLKPAVLFLHGGNALGNGHWAPMKAYIEAGYVVMMPSLRGENGQSGNFSGFYDEVSDVLAAGERLSHLPGIDKDRVFIAGHSVGGVLAMLTAMTTHHFRAASPISGNPNAFRFFNRYPEDIRFDEKNTEEFVVRSPTCFAGSFKCPTLLQHGSEETRLQESTALLLKRAAEKAKFPVTSTVVAGNHNSAIPGAAENSLRFFQQFSV